ncbi:3879_t:CDS:1, partial [Funneliformis geosporum]
MSTINQLVRKPRRAKKLRRKNQALASGWNSLKRAQFEQPSPQKSGNCKKVGKLTPRKPNSAFRSFARVELSNKKVVTVYVPGEGHNLQDFSAVLVQGGGAKDLAGVKNSVIRGVADAAGVKGRKQGRSIYGVKKP